MDLELSADEEAAVAARRVGEVLAGKWKLDELLGIGGMAAVYAATHQNNMKRVALKVLHPTIAASVEARKRFLREGYIANKVNHPGAVSVIDDGTGDDGSVYLVMELLEGESLRAKADARGGKIPPRELVRYVIDLLEVLGAAHDAGIVHRDLKADNVFVTSDDKVKVLDFGVARMREVGEGKTRTGVVMGTPEYMPPEQARGRSELIDGRTDLWAVGAMMFKLLTGKYPHQAETANEVLLLAMTEPAPKLATVLSDVNEKLAELVDTAMAFEKESRFPNAQRMQSFAREVLSELEKDDNRATAVGIQADLVVASAKTISAAETPSGKGLWVHEKASPPVPPRPPPKSRLGGRLVLFAFLLAAIAGLSGYAFVKKLRAGGADDPLPAATAAVPEAGAPLAIASGAPEAEAGVEAADAEVTDDDDDDNSENPYAEIEASAPPPATAHAVTPGPTTAKPAVTVKKPIVPKATTHNPKKKKR